MMTNGKCQWMLFISLFLLFSGCTHVHRVNLEQDMVPTTESGKEITYQATSSIEKRGDYELWFKMGAHTHNLESDTSTLALITSTIQKALVARGYKIVDSESGDAIDVNLTRFNIGNVMAMWSFSFQTNIGAEVTMTVDGKEHSFFVKGWGKNVCQVLNAPNLERSITYALEDFSTNLNQELDSRGL